MKKFFPIFILVLASLILKAQAPGCPNVTISAPGASQGQVTIPCNDCITLTADVLHTGATNTYAVSSIPYAPPYPYNSGTPILVNIDDRWSSVITLPFTFCYFGTGYTQLIAGSNGVVSFDLTDANGYCPWSFSATCPSASLITNAIFGVYHDIDPAVSGTMYQAVLGSYPCRTFVVNWNQVAMFSCNYLIATHQIVLYEATNVIEVYVQNAPLCATWNSGNKLIGIQNAAGNMGFTPPGRNTAPWSATNEAWRFTPNGAQNYTIQWYQGAVPIGSGPTINVCPTAPTTYTAIATYDNCNYTQVVVTDEILVNPGDLTIDINPTSADICDGESVNISTTATGNGPFTYDWSPATGLSATNTANVTATPSTSTTYTVTVTDNLGCSGSLSVDVNVHPAPTIAASISEDTICAGQSSVISAAGGNTYNWSGIGAGQSHTVSPMNTTTYSVTGTDANGCTGTANVTLTVNPGPTISISNPNPDICLGQSTNMTASGGSTYTWNTGDNTSQINVNPNTNTTYQVTGTDVNGCVGTATTEVFVHDQPVVDFTANKLSGCAPLSVNFTSQVTSSDPISAYYWEFGAAASHGSSTLENPSKIFNQAGHYDISLTVTSDYGCISSITKPLYIEVYPQPVAAFMADPTTAEIGSSLISFYDQSTGATLWYWTFGDGATSTETNPTHYYEQPGQFGVVLTVSNEFGCVDSTWRWINILHFMTFYVPNAFSPGDDGVNDLFGPTGVGIKEINFYIYDRWGKMVFFSDHMDKKWDGKINDIIPDVTTVFTWKAQVTFSNNIKEDFSGNLVLIR